MRQIGRVVIMAIAVVLAIPVWPVVGLATLLVLALFGGYYREQLARL